MYLINELYDKAMEELEESECYAKLALELKGTKENIASKLIRLSEEESTQSDSIISIIKELQDEKRRTGQLSDKDITRCDMRLEFYNKEKAKVKIIQTAYKM